MREIKFRAWDKRESKMWVPIIDQDGFPCARHPVSMQLVRMDGELLDPVMQYTGLKDKNGKEIYEGDIMEWEYYSNLPSTRCMESLIKRGVVTWFKTHTHFSIKSEGGPYSVGLGGSAIKRKEVIGNIYENPELLED